MVVKVYGDKGSTCTQRVLTTLFEKNVPFEFAAIYLAAGEQKSQKHLKLQPFGKIPVLDDDGFILFESRAIAKYIAAKYTGQGTPLLPAESDLKAYGMFEQACSVEEFYFDPAAYSITFEKVFKAWTGLGSPDEAQLTKHAAALDTTLAVYEGVLSKTKYLAGDEITLADLFHLPYGVKARDAGYLNLFEKYPHVKEWFDSLLARESWKKVSS